MGAKISDVLMGTYKQYEGPVYWGKIPYIPAKTPDFLDKALRTVCATEGGKYDAVNMYDSCIVTLGISQLCLSAHVLEGMLGGCVEVDPDKMKNILGSLPTPATLKKNSRGLWRFFFLDGREVESTAQMREMFLSGAIGLKNQWSPQQEEFAKKVAVIFANLWEDERFRKVQSNWSKSSLPRFIMPQTKKVFLTLPSDSGWQGALKAAVISYSMNNPKTADLQFVKATSNPAWSGSSDEEKFSLAMTEMVKNGIGIWPGRYEDIAPVLREEFGVNVPPLESIQRGAVSMEPLKTAVDVQKFLISMGYDLGPKAVDGVIGKKTTAAILDFQRSNQLQQTGTLDKGTLRLMNIIKINNP